MTEDERRALLWPGLSLPERAALVWLVAQCGLEGRGMAMAELRAVTGLSDRPAREAVATLLRRGLVRDEGYARGQPKLRVLSVPWIAGGSPPPPPPLGAAVRAVPAMRLPAAGLIVSSGVATGANAPPRTLAREGKTPSSSRGAAEPAASPGGGGGGLHACPADFQPSPAIAAIIAARWPALNVAYEVATFTLYFAVERPDERRVGWQRHFLNWCERSARRPARATAGAGGAAARAGRRQSGGEWLDDAIDQMSNVIEGATDE